MYLNDERFNYRPTHMNVEDGSTAMRVYGVSDGFWLINEDGFMWRDFPEEWTRIQPNPTEGLVVRAEYWVA